MLSIRATYDGKKIKLADKLKINTPQEVIITFLEDDEIPEKEKEMVRHRVKTAKESDFIEWKEVKKVLKL
jgi:hypothetical protein